MELTSEAGSPLRIHIWSGADGCTAPQQPSTASRSGVVDEERLRRWTHNRAAERWSGGAVE